jgi:hypothetical protein
MLIFSHLVSNTYLELIKMMRGPTPMPFTVSLPINIYTNVVAGVPVVLNWISVGTYLASFRSDAGAGSDRVPPTATTADGTAYKDFRDPQGTWRDTSTGLPVPPQRQTDLTRDWNQAVDGMRTWDTQVPLNIPLGLPTNVDNQCNRDYTAARGWTLPRDPLVLDLDGDGIETVGINPLAPVLFDHDNDGVRTGTGWIKSDDGLLVLDRNGNGTIDGGAELFGDNTPGAAGTPVANGYIALQAQDSNSDGQINNQDASYTQLRVWRDLNQDGISQAGELQTLGQAGIASIGVAGTTTNINLGNGNTQIASGSFTRTNGSTGQSGTAELTGSYLLAGNNIRYFISSCSRDILLACRPKKHTSSCQSARLRKTHALRKTRDFEVSSQPLRLTKQSFCVSLI